MLQGDNRSFFVVWEIHICYKEKSIHCICYNRVTHLLQRDEHGRYMSYYNEIMVVFCYNGDSHLLQNEVQALCLSYKCFTTVLIREEWKVGCKWDSHMLRKVFVVSEIHALQGKMYGRCLL